jgi:uracil-DNA glycosylase family 4
MQNFLTQSDYWKGQVSFKGCIPCGLWRTSKSVAVPSDGPLESPLVFVAESLGEDEEILGRNAVGNAGKKFNELLQMAGTSRDDVLFTSCVKCRPPRNRTTAAHVDHCRRFLVNEMSRFPNKRVIMPLGEHALYSVLGKKKISTWVGMLMRSGEFDCLVLPNFHPAYLFHKPGAEDWVVRLIEQAVALAHSETWSPGVAYVEDYAVLEDFDEILAYLESLVHWEGRLGYDLEASSLNPWQARLLCSMFSERPGHSRLLPYEINEDGQKRRLWTPQQEAQIKKLRYRVLTNPRATWSGANLNYDFKVEAVQFLPWPFDPVTGFDVGNAVRCTDENMPHGLKEQAATVTTLGRWDLPVAEWFDANPKHKNQYEELPSRDVLWPYALKDPDASLRVEDVLTDLLEKKETATLYHTLEKPMGDVLRRMEYAGVRVDVERIQDVGKGMQDLIDENMQWFLDHDVPITNVKSPKQLVAYFIGTLGLPVYRETEEGNPSMKEEVLFYYAGVYGVEAARKVRVASKLRHFKSTFLDGSGTGKGKGLLGFVQTDGKIHTEFRQWPVTGRLSCIRPNLQAIPRPTEIGEYSAEEVKKGMVDPRRLQVNVRNVFIPSAPGWVIGEGDFAQMELRIASIWWQDDFMRRQFSEGVDLHSWVTENVIGVKHAEVSREQWEEARAFAKRINFGVLYGMGPGKLSAQLGIPLEEAEEFLARFFDLYQGIRDGIEETKRFTRQHGYSPNWAGRRRHLPGVKSGDKRVVGEALRQAINHPIQGGGADIIFRAMIDLDRELRTRYPGKARLLIQVHDSLIFEAKEEVIEEVTRLVKVTMEQPIPELDGYQFPVDLELCDSWKGANVLHIEGVTKPMKKVA